MTVTNKFRRELLIGAAAGIVSTAAWTAAAIDHAVGASEALAALERQSGGRLGVAMLDTATGAIAGHRLDERFAMCSTFKLLLAALILKEVDAGRVRLDQIVPFSQKDMVPYAPVTERFLAQGGMTVSALAQAAQEQSDNVAANLLLPLIGGPAGFTARLRALGDATTRLDRLEPALNVVKKGDERDTTSASAMSRSVARVLLDDSPQRLQPSSAKLLISWMLATETGLKRLRAGFPADWKAGDRTGTALAPGMFDKYNDVAIVWPPGKAPLVVTAFHETAASRDRMRDEDQAVLAAVGRIAADWIRR